MNKYGKANVILRRKVDGNFATVRDLVINLAKSAKIYSDIDTVNGIVNIESLNISQEFSYDFRTLGAYTLKKSVEDSVLSLMEKIDKDDLVGIINNEYEFLVELYAQ